MMKKINIKYILTIFYLSEFILLHAKYILHKQINMCLLFFILPLLIIYVTF